MIYLIIEPKTMEQIVSPGNQDKVTKSDIVTLRQKLEPGSQGGPQVWTQLYTTAKVNDNFPLRPVEDEPDTLVGSIDGSLQWLEEHKLGIHTVYKHMLEVILKERNAE